MFNGRVVADATPAQMKVELAAVRGQLLEVSTGQPHQALAALRAAGFDHAELHGRHVHVTAHEPAVAIMRIRDVLTTSGMTDVRVVPQELTMEDVFVQRVLALEAADSAADSGADSALALGTTPGRASAATSTAAPVEGFFSMSVACLLYTSPSPRD